ncbi:helix-turn-helix transcriptional regulator [Vagococcus sp. BWB3-3]|uniref:Helix-turn-helix transcriptional regulator n=1 Tax=Vagococcus allomyrinae TaxID=2794353 RepID=A0A940SX38_9ENTE|nr:helix-turn-helix transcriptional regulator [Vagococcus allomyrinae]MBP1042851.1 helix-turn-helix transcriptional regulator [Vagococcus allomyrinae]
MTYFNFGSKIKSARIKKGLSQKDLADGLCTQGLVSKIEKGEVIPNALLLKDLCLKLTVSIDFILADDVLN